MKILFLSIIIGLVSCSMSLKNIHCAECLHGGNILCMKGAENQTVPEDALHPQMSCCPGISHIPRCVPGTRCWDGVNNILPYVFCTDYGWCPGIDYCPEMIDPDYTCSSSYNNSGYAMAALCPVLEGPCGNK